MELLRLQPGTCGLGVLGSIFFVPIKTIIYLNDHLPKPGTKVPAMYLRRIVIHALKRAARVGLAAVAISRRLFGDGMGFCINFFSFWAQPSAYSVKGIIVCHLIAPMQRVLYLQHYKAHT